jgi:histidinol dehydrogenase
MRILDWNSLDRPGRLAALARPQAALRAEAARPVSEIIARVRIGGDKALLALTEQFDRVRLDSVRVDAAEFEAARKAVGAAETAALLRAITNVHRFHEAQEVSSLSIETEPGVRCESIVRPISPAGLYVPAGSAPLPSTLIMLAVPADVAGCLQRIVCTPPRPDGSVHPAILVAAHLTGIDTVFKVGGAQAIAALAYGTDSIPKVDKIFGPGNAWVTTAKQLVAQDPNGAACDLPAGPSEVMVVADDSARAEFVAADLLAQLEHDPLAQAILVTDSSSLAGAVARELDAQRARLSRGSIIEASLKSCRCLKVGDLDVALRLVNDYAPEHLILQLCEPRQYLTQVRHAGSVFLGPWTPEPIGDYCSGTNHVLPTYGHARALSGLTVRDFCKTIAVQELTPAALKSLGPTAVTLATLEGLDAHANAIERRLRALAQRSEPTQSPASAVERVS